MKISNDFKSRTDLRRCRTLRVFGTHGLSCRRTGGIPRHAVVDETICHTVVSTCCFGACRCVLG